VETKNETTTPTTTSREKHGHPVLAAILVFLALVVWAGLRAHIHGGRHVSAPAIDGRR
jgi:hypothetical protein